MNSGEDYGSNNMLVTLSLSSRVSRILFSFLDSGLFCCGCTLAFWIISADISTLFSDIVKG